MEKEEADWKGLVLHFSGKLPVAMLISWRNGTCVAARPKAQKGLQVTSEL